MQDRIYEQYGSMNPTDLYELLASVSVQPDLMSLSNRALDIDDKARPAGLEKIGRNIFRRWVKSAHDFACKPTESDKELADKLKVALTGQAGGIAIIAGVLVSTFGLAPVTSALIAALMMRIFVAPTADEVCKVWSGFLADNPA